MKLISGLGGGLDVVNALLLYYAVPDSILGSVNSASIESIKNHTPFAECGTWISQDSRMTARGRYAEPRLAEVMDDYVMYFSRKFKREPNPSRLRKSFLNARHGYNLEHMFFVDGGGDSLILVSEDANELSQYDDPFKGGDAHTLSALWGIPNCYLVVLSVGLDIREEAFHKNVELLREKGAYFGAVNLVTGEKRDYALDHLIPFDNDYLCGYLETAKKVLALDGMFSRKKLLSHTGIVSYHAMRSNFGIKRTYVPWEPTTNGRKGVLVKEEHQWAYFFDTTEVETLKMELNI